MQKPVQQITYIWENKGIHTFPRVIRPKVNVITWLEFELGYFDVVVQVIRHHATGTPSSMYKCQSMRKYEYEAVQKQYIYIVLLWLFYGTSTLLGYLMPKPFS